MHELIGRIRKCDVCKIYLPHQPNPILTASAMSKIAIIGQAPGSVVHSTGIPWNDKSGERLRSWLGVDTQSFYDPNNFALIPMGFCYPGKGNSGDLPPRKECAPLWHNALFNEMKHLELIILVGTYAQSYYLKELNKSTLTETVFNAFEYLPTYFPLPHPSPRNNIWLKRNSWFESEILPPLIHQVANILHP